MNRADDSLKAISTTGQDADPVVRDLVALLALTTLWRGRDVQAIAQGLTESLFGILHPVFVYVGVRSSADDAFVAEAACLDSPWHSSAALTEVRELLNEHWPTPGEVRLAAFPGKKRRLRLLSAPIGLDASFGVLVVGAASPAFPSDGQRVLISAAANQAAGALATALRLQSLTTDLGRSERFAQALVDASADCIKTLDLDGRLLSMSDAGRRALGIDDFAPYRHQSWIDFWQGADRAAAAAAVAAARAGGSGRFQGSHTANGETKWWDVVLTPISGADGEPAQLLAVSRDITELRRGELARQQAAQDYRTIFELAGHGAAQSDIASKRFLRVNRRFTELFGYTEDELRQLTFLDVTHVDDREDSIQGIARVVSGEIAEFAVDKRYVRKDGGVFWGALSATLVRDARGRPTQIVALVRDITTLKQTEAALRESEARLRISYENAPVGIAEATPAGQLVFANAKFCELTGYSRDELLSKRTVDITHPDDRQQDYLLYQQLLKGEIDSYKREKRYVRKDGTAIWASLTVSQVRDAQGQPKYAVGIIEDIGERKRAEEERARLLDAEREARTEAELLNHLGRIISAELKLDKLLQSVTDVGTALSGAQFGAFFLGADNAPGEPPRLYAVSGIERQAFADGSLPRLQKIFEHTFAGRGVVRLDDATQDPRYVPAAPRRGQSKHQVLAKSCLALPVLSRSGRVLGGLFFGHPEAGRFSERHERTLLGVAAHAAVAIDNASLFEDVKSREERLRAIYEHAPVGIGECDLRGRFLVVNPKLCDITGYPPAELLDRGFRDLSHPDDVAADDVSFERLTRGELPAYRIEQRYVRRDGTAIWVERTASLVRDGDGQPRYVVNAVEDITGRRAVAEALQASERRYRDIFESANVALFEEDCGAVRRALQALTRQGVTDVQAYVDAHPEFVRTALSQLKVDDVNQAAVRLFEARDKDELLASLPQTFISESYSVLAAELVALAQGQRQFTAEAQLQTLRGRRIDVLLSVTLPAADQTRALVSLTDITERKRVEARSRFLADASTTLASSLDIETTLRQFAQLAVPGLADWCTVDMVRDDGSFARLALAHADPVKLAQAQALMQRFPPNAEADFGTYRVVKQVMQSRQAQWLAEVPDALLVAIAKDPEHLAVLRSFGFKSFVCAPLVVRDAVIGAITFAYADSPRRYEPADLELIREVARRLAIAVDNARLYRAAQREIAERRQAEQALIDSQERLGLALAAGHMGHWSQEYGADARLVWSSEAAAMFGLSPAATAGAATSTEESFYELVLAEDRAHVRGVIADAIDRREDFKVEYRISPPNAMARWVEARGRPYFDADGRLQRVAGVIIDVTERKLAEQALRASEARFQAIFNHALDAIVLVDDDGTCVDVNPAACQLLGYERAELLAPATADRGFRELWRRLQARGEPAGECEFTRGDGRLIAVAYRAVANILPGLHLSVLIDISERKRAEAALEARARQQAAVARLGQAALEGDDLSALLTQAATVVMTTLGADLSDVLTTTPDGAGLRLAAGVGWRDGLVGTAVGAGEESFAGYTLKVNAPIVVVDVESESRFRPSPLLTEHGVVSGMSVPIAGEGDRAYGVLSVYMRAPRRFSPEDLDFLQAVSHVLTTAIHRQRVAQALTQARSDLEQRVIERTAELAKINDTLRDEIVERMGVEAALRDSEAQYRLLFERNPLPAWVFDLDTRDILAANETAVWRYGYTRDEFLHMAIHDLHPPADLTRPLDYTERFPPETAYVGLWRHRKQDESIIDVEVFVYEVLFQGRWARLVLANDITERKRLEEEMRLIDAVTRAVNDAGNVDQALGAMLAQVCKTTGWPLAEAWVQDEHDGTLLLSPSVYAAGDRFDKFIDASRRRRTKPGLGLVGQAWSACQPVWAADVAADPRFRRGPSAAEIGIRSAVTFPVHVGQNVLAVLAFFMTDARREDDRQVQLVSTLAAQVGLAIQRKQAEAQLRESEERFRLLVEGARDYCIYMLDREGRVVSWNAGAERLKGYATHDILGRHYACFFTPEDAKAGAPQKGLARALADGSVEAEGWRVRKDGSRFWASSVLTVLRDASGDVRGFVKLTRDITERREAEQRLRESEARLTRAQEFSLLMVAQADLAGRWLKVPQTLCALLGYTEKELLAGGFQQVTHPDDVAAETALCQRLIRAEAKSFDLEKRFLRRDGKVIWVYQNTSVVLDTDDRPVQFLLFVRDITSRKEAEEELRKSQLQLLEAQRLAHMGSWEWDVGAERVQWSDELYRIHGLAPGAPMSHARMIELLYADDRARVQAEFEAAINGNQPFSFEQRIVRADNGEVRYLHNQGAVIADDRGKVTRVIGVCLEITERKRAEERLREYAGRLEGLSTRLLEAQETERRRIARELHDQIGQDLSVIKINLLTLQRLPGGAALGAPLDETIRIVEAVLSTARNLSLELRPSMLDDLGLASALRWYLDRQAQRAGFNVQLLVDGPEERISPTIETASFRLTQEAITNIMRHAKASRVVVELRRRDNELRLRISDDGVGFDTDAARRRAASGESFGLLGMEERTLLAGGTLEISSVPGQGTEVLAYFPIKGAGK